MNRAAQFMHEAGTAMEKDYAALLKRSIGAIKSSLKELEVEVASIVSYLESDREDAPGYDTLASEARSVVIELGNAVDSLKKTLVNLSDED